MCHDGTATTISKPNIFVVCKNVMYHKTGKLSSRQMKTETVFVFMLANEQARPIFCEGKGGEIVDVVVEWRIKEEKIKSRETSTHAYSSGCCYLHQRRNFCQVWTHKDEEETFLIFMSTSVGFLKSSYMENSILTYKKRMTTKLKTLPLYTAFVRIHADITFGSI